MEKLGALAAFGTAVSWSLSAVFFENATRRAGALAVNFWKVAFAFVLLSIAGLVSRGLPLPTDASTGTWVILSISGIIGFVVADYFLFNAYLIIGSRTTVVFQALTPLFTAFFAFAFLGEGMELLPLSGMLVVVLGIIIVVMARSAANGRRASDGASSADGAARPSVQGARKGYVFAFLSSVFQAGGLLFSKVGLGGYSAIAGTQIRVLSGMAGFGIMALALGQGKQVFHAPLRDRTVLKSLGLGSVFGPFVGVSLSLYALQNASAGTASTLMALTPVLIIPVSVFILGQKVRKAEILGACIAVAGATIFFVL
ncbi:MAG TPA: DMT family transporter [Rectinemataceae bacterium]